MRLTNSQPALECLRDSPLPSVATGLSPTPNRRICGFAFGYAQICLWQTSHIPRTLSEILISFEVVS